jgi:hypothetical protein
MTDTQLAAHHLAAHHLAAAIGRLRRIERDIRAGIPTANVQLRDAWRDVEHYRGVYTAQLAIAGAQQ